jgi:hypothetical protein
MCPCTMPPAYAVSSADWLTLSQKFGLAPNLDDRTNEFAVPVASFGLADAHEKAASQDENLRLPTTVARV